MLDLANLSKPASTGLSLIPGDSHDSDIGDGLVAEVGRPITYKVSEVDDDIWV